MTWVQRDGYRYIDLGEGNDSANATPFVIPDLVASTVTLLYSRHGRGLVWATRPS
jgi:hypothetical protein